MRHAETPLRELLTYMSTEKLLSEIRTLDIKIEAQARRYRAQEQRRERIEHLERQFDRLEEAHLKLEKRKLQLDLDADHGLDDDDEVEAVGERIRLVEQKMSALRSEVDALRATMVDDEVSTLKLQLRRKLSEVVPALRAEGRLAEVERIEARLEAFVAERRLMIARALELLLESRNHLVRASADLDATEHNGALPAGADAGHGARRRSAVLVRAGARAFREAWESLVVLASAWEDARAMAVERDWLAVPFEDVGRRIEPPPVIDLNLPAGDDDEVRPEAAVVPSLHEASRDLKAVTLWVNELRARLAVLKAEHEN